MARTKRKPSSTNAAENLSAQPPSSATSWLQPSIESKPSKCPACGAEFEFMLPEEINEHDLICGPALPTLDQDTAVQTTENEDYMASASHEQSRESSSRLTTPPGSPVNGSVNGEELAIDPIDPDSDSGSVGDQLNGDDHVEEPAIVQVNDNGTLPGDSNEELIGSEPTVFKNDLTSTVSAYVGDQMDCYDFEPPKFQAETGQQDNAESLTPAFSSRLGSESVEQSEPLELPSLSAAGSKFKFRKLTAPKIIVDYLANPDEMSYEMLYHRTQVVANILGQYRHEYQDADREVKDFMAGTVLSKEDKAAQDREAERVKLLELEAADGVLWRLYNLYFTKLQVLGESGGPIAAEATGDDETDPGEVPSKGRKKKINDRAWKRYATDLLKSYPKDAALSSQLASLMQGTTLKGLVERRSQREKPVVRAPTPTYKGLDLIDVPLPKVDEPKSKKRDFEGTLVNFEFRKMADVYGLPGLQMGADGYVNLQDRNGDAPREGRGDRPVRARKQAPKYDTEQSEAPGNSSDDVPAKRRRIDALAPNSPVPPSRTRTGASTAHASPQRTFPSGKRIGRPRGSGTGTGVKSSKVSKLKVWHLPDTELPDVKLHTQELPATKEVELQEAAQALIDQTHADLEVPLVPKKGKHGGPRKKGVSTKTGVPMPVKPARGKRTKKELSEKFISEDGDVFPSTEADDASRFASASVSRPTTASSAETIATSGTRRSTRQSTREQSKAPPVAAPKRKRIADADEDAIEVAAPETKEPTAKRRKGIKATSIPPPSIEPVGARESPAPLPVKSSRQKKTGSKAAAKAPRKKATHDGKGKLMIPIPPGTIIGGEPKSASEEVTAKPSRKTKAAKRVGEKGEIVKPAVKPRRKTRAQTSEEPDLEDESEDTESEPVKTTKKARRPAAKGTIKSRDIKTEPTNDEDLTEAELKAKQKSAKLSAATKKRWETGGMAGPMEKRKATNEAKRAAKKLIKTDTPASTTTVPTPAPHVPPPINTSASSSATRTSGRKRKPTSRAMGGMDGADDSESSSDEEEMIGGVHKKMKRMSEYEHFQALSSPGTPALPKRRSKQMFNLKAFIGSEEEEDEESEY